MKNEASIEERIRSIEERNERVESDKAWETSVMRKIVLIMLTYVAIGGYLRAVNISEPWLNALVPSVAFMLSTLTLPFFKRVWAKYLWRRKK